MNILVDNTVLSHLAVVPRPELLRTAFGDLVATSEEVLGELKAGVSRGKLPALDWAWLPVWTLTEKEKAYCERLRRRGFLHPDQARLALRISKTAGAFTRREPHGDKAEQEGEDQQGNKDDKAPHPASGLDRFGLPVFADGASAVQLGRPNHGVCRPG